MKLSTWGRYGLRAMVDLALHRAYPGGGHAPGSVSLSEVARRQDISVDYLRQILLKMKSAGLVRSSRGRSGGYALSRPPEKLNALEILEVLGEELAPVFCVRMPEECERAEKCSTHPLWLRLYGQMREVLAATTLAQLAAECPRNGVEALPHGYFFDI